MPDEAWGLTELALITVGVRVVLWVFAHIADILERGDRWPGS